MSDTAQTTDPVISVDESRRAARHVVFRVMMGLLALLLILAFGAWQGLITPWVTLPDSTDHGWQRTPELHRLSDTLGPLLMLALGVVAAWLAIRPRGNSALTAWLLGMLAVFGVTTSPMSMLVQGQPVLDALVFAPIWWACAVLLPWFFAPDRRAVLRGGKPAPSRPTAAASIGALAVIVVGAAAAVGATIWRLSGGVFENPLEDDVFSFVLLGLSLVLGGTLVARGREGWQRLAVVLAALTCYAALGVVVIVVGQAL